jgi:hypothetical protein
MERPMNGGDRDWTLVEYICLNQVSWMSVQLECRDVGYTKIVGVYLEYPISTTYLIGGISMSDPMHQLPRGKPQA